jgi:RNA polymerase primary sigma factor
MRQLKISKSITNRESASLEKYLQEIGKVDLLEPNEESTLALAIKNGCKKSLDKLVSGNLRFVVSVAKQYQNQGLSLPDLINEGNLGLIKAALRYDETKGFKFISYAVWWIRQSILQALAEQSRIVRLPLNKVNLQNRISKAYHELEQNFEREPTAEELAELLEEPLEDINAILKNNHKHISVDTPLNDTEEGTLIDVMINPNADMVDEKLVYHDSLRKEITSSLAMLTDRQKKILCYFFGLGTDHALSLEDIGEKFHLTRERVRQIKDKALTKLKASKRTKQLKYYLG